MGFALGISLGLRLYFTVYPSSRHNTDTVQFMRTVDGVQNRAVQRTVVGLTEQRRFGSEELRGQERAGQNRLYGE